MIDRSEIIDLLNQVQLIQSKLIILLERYEHDQTEAVQRGTVQPVWTSDSSGQGQETVVHSVA